MSDFFCFQVNNQLYISSFAAEKKNKKIILKILVVCFFCGWVYSHHYRVGTAYIRKHWWWALSGLLQQKKKTISKKQCLTEILIVFFPVIWLGQNKLKRALVGAALELSRNRNIIIHTEPIADSLTYNGICHFGAFWLCHSPNQWQASSLSILSQTLFYLFYLYLFRWKTVLSRSDVCHVLWKGILERWIWLRHL